MIGGAVGAFPPVIGWTIATNYISIEPIILFLIIFFWTPSHFWALSLYKNEDYKKANIPMLSVIAGEDYTKKNIFIYSIILLPITLLPFVFDFASYMNFFTVLFFGTSYIYLSYKLLGEKDKKIQILLQIRFLFFPYFIFFFIFSTILLDNYFLL